MKKENVPKCILEFGRHAHRAPHTYPNNQSSGTVTTYSNTLSFVITSATFLMRIIFSLEPYSCYYICCYFYSLTHRTALFIACIYFSPLLIDMFFLSNFVCLSVFRNCNVGPCKTKNFAHCFIPVNLCCDNKMFQ